MGLYNYHIRLMNPFALPYKAMPKATANFDNLGIIEKQKITPIANDEYAQWRYVKNPHHYEFINYRENNNTALFIVRINRYFNKNYHFQIKELLLIDCQLSSFNDLFIEHAMNHLSRLYAHKARYIRTFFNPMTDRGMVLNNFFHRKMKKRYETLIIKPISDSLPLEIFLNFDNWDILPHVKDSF